jgi:hypothetical protein
MAHIQLLSSLYFLLGRVLSPLNFFFLVHRKKGSVSQKAEELRVARYCKMRSQIPLCDLIFSKSTTKMSTSTLIRAAAELLLKNKNLTAKQALLACEATVKVATTRHVHRAVKQIEQTI